MEELADSRAGANSPGSGADGTDAMIACRDLTVRFRKGEGSMTVLDDLSLDIHRGEFICLVGPSGCGKSTLLNTIAGVVLPTSGVVRVGGVPVETLRTDVGYMRQKPALLPWRTVRRNVAYGLELAGAQQDAIDETVESLLAQVGLSDAGDQYPHELSGGMQQRASLARTLAVQREVLLMDEPFASLDAQTRDYVEADLLRLHSARGLTVVFVTHDLAEAVALADRVVLMAFGSGRIRRDYEIALPRPRDPMDIRVDPKFTALYTDIWNALREEVVLGTRRDDRGHDG